MFYYMNCSNIFPIIISVFIFVCILIFTQSGIKSQTLLENFANLEQAGPYPASLQNPILNSYQANPRPQLSTLSYAQMSRSYPVYPANSLTNNNIRNWPLPNNGTCSPAEFCNALYEPNPISVNRMDISIWNGDNGNCSRRVNRW
jgi:hypothetical protein